ncbi:hypothetical protein D3C75_904100 [compost metagenome]
MLAAAHAGIGGDHQAAVGVEDAVAQGIRGEAAEYHRVHGADACAGEHGTGGFGDHRHVDAHPVALVHAQLLERIGQAADLLVQLAVAEVPGLGGIVALPDDRGLFAAPGQVAVEAVVGDVQLAALEPTGLPLAQVAMVHAAPGFEPVEEQARLFGPEQLRLLDGLPVQPLVVVGMHGGMPVGGCRDRVGTDLEHGGDPAWSCAIFFSVDPDEGAFK